MKYSLRIWPLILTALLSSCSPVKKEQIYQNAFSENQITIDQQITFSQTLNQFENHYLVFFYSETCTNCHEIRGDVLAFAEDNIVKTYFIDIKQSNEEVPTGNSIDLTIGATSANDLFIAGTPTIIEVEDWAVKANVPGRDNVLTLLNELRLTNKN